MIRGLFPGKTGCLGKQKQKPLALKPFHVTTCFHNQHKSLCNQYKCLYFQSSLSVITVFFSSDFLFCVHGPLIKASSINKKMLLQYPNSLLPTGIQISEVLLYEIDNSFCFINLCVNNYYCWNWWFFILISESVMLKKLSSRSVFVYDFMYDSGWSFMASMPLIRTRIILQYFLCGCTLIMDKLLYPSP